MTKVTVHPDALKAAQIGWRLNADSMKGALEAALQWCIDHPQITVEQVSQLRRGVCSFDGNRKFRDKFLTLALSGKPEVPPELRDAFGN